MASLSKGGYATIKDEGTLPVEVQIHRGPEGQGEYKHSEDLLTGRRRIYGGILLAVTMSSLFVALTGGKAAASADESLPMVEATRGSGHPPNVVVRTCTFSECEAAGCDIETAPFLCVDESGPYLGCSAQPWDPAAGCKNSCTLEHCTRETAPKGTPSCQGVQCGEDWCDPESSMGVYQRCGAKAPYQCLKGSAAMGCSADEHGWALASDSTCSECCDTTTC